ncbi:SDR family oxidoreductase [Stieleria varia]|uniref:Enoyl-[acyl-carrier-protein] reductase [NADPH] FabL n=1 Tax=Stieleria varia TaxID=2528005 RepID=A0A5C6B8L8_9BACT|nr:SDR family oxidoreductase [Stieleria varia]TWU08318.1 Enoyl-[acyl-carrier-protein] reductase [NADPH] FabL [Stieleria varia]
MSSSEIDGQCLSGRCALVTGASRGIGRATAIELARQGAHVAVNFLNSQASAVSVAEEIDALGGQVMLVRADVSSRDDTIAMIQQVTQQFGALDIVVSNAAAGGFRSLMDLTPVNLEATLRTNSAAALWLAQAAAEPLSASSGHGKLVAISSHGSQWAVPHYGAIGASKAALESMIRHLALELGERGINFNCVLPGIIATEAIATMPGAESMVQAAKDRMMVGQRDLTAQDVAKVVAFLCSPASDLIQGQTIVVDGGVSIRV